MTDWRSTAVKAAAALLVVLAAAGCTSGNENKSAAPDTAATDRDPRNNENNTLGAKSLPSDPGVLPQRDSVDKTEFHYNSRLAMNEVLSERLRTRVPELAAAYVALTESNAYAAVKLKGPHAQSLAGTAADSQEPMADGKSGAGIFGMGQGGNLDWRAQDGMTTELQSKISRVLHELAPGKANIFVSSNPNYVRRMKYYAEQSRAGTSMDHFINEFNTMAHYAFPYNANAANIGNR
ncbi:hypothetical protein SD70_15270 [Gordoniibacillus kamchatkensis]|uniref:YhcN/YlaJ family sporulation lipoprotein n=1 Tax=Gordoniibacillus kamchatkensis TaxID=1590651 RepID=A0ABR5AHW5_9BACL|nr:YhcN/YlaJ family sporulation lipoprotein [Paenibacillus sp. VKM B-2647]KIL40180.1 hypothetical protein SD70_15270 [Paenibacillus sp. VKM B-2647]